MKNLEIAKILYAIADILELQEVPWKPQAYRKAAQSVESLTENIEDIYQQGKLEEIPGIGKNIAEKIGELIETGKLKYYEDLKQKFKVNIEQLRSIPGLGPKKIKQLYQQLNVRDVADLEKALQQQKLRTLAGFGEKTERILSEGIQFFKTKPKRFLYAQVQPIVHSVLQQLKKHSAVQRAEVAGSFRRGKETIGDLDFLAVSEQPDTVMKLFTTLPDVKEIIAHGRTKSSVRLYNGLQMDLRVVQEKEFGSALQYFIGNKDHNVEIRKLALRQGYTLNEYGLFTVKGKKWVAGRTEQEIYSTLGLQYIEPELRENMGELVAAQHKQLPNIITTNDVRGIFHNHSAWSDGNNSLLEMAQQAEQLGLKFISFNDHFGQVGITNPLNEKRLIKYLQEIEAVRKKVNIRVFSGVEIDILQNGTLPSSPKKLRELDVVIASVHLATKMSLPEMTKRVCSVLENYPVNILGHPTDRILNQREPIALDLEKVFTMAHQRNTFLEINGSPERMDLAGEQIKQGIDAGCQFALSADAHDIRHLEHYPLSVISARRGWAEQKDILNCWTLPKIEKALRK